VKLVLIFLCAWQVWALSAGNQKKSHIDFYNNIPVIHLYGTPTQMAMDYARIVKKPLVGAVSMLKLFYGKRLKHLYKRAKRLEPALPKHIKTEMRILAKQTGLSYDDIVLINIVPEIQCSTVSVWGKHTKNRQLIMGRNLDFFIGKLDWSL
jgi:hypothetical protein